MLKALSKKVKGNEGFTLIELVIVIAIIGLLVAIAVPRMADARKNAAIATHNANVRTLESAANMYLAENGMENLPITDTGSGAISNYVQEWPEAAKGTGDATVDGIDYSVNIDDQGAITVTPAKLPTP